MEKKDIYDHLAKIYLDASSKKKKKTKAHPQIFKTLLFVTTILVVGLSLIQFWPSRKFSPYQTQISLVLLNEASKINFNFDPAKKEIYSLDLKGLNLSPYKMLGFSVKKTNHTDQVALKVEFSNKFLEKSDIYLKNISNRWQDYRINISDFKKINDWREMSSLSFIVEEWNVRDKKGEVYIDNIRLLK